MLEVPVLDPVHAMSRPADGAHRKSEHRVSLAFHAGSLALDLVPPVLTCVVVWILVTRLLHGFAVLTATAASLLLFAVVVYLQWTALARRRATWGMRALRIELGDTRGGRHRQVRLGVRSAYFGVVFVAVFLDSVARSLTTDGRIPGMGLFGLVVLVDTFALALSPNRVALHDLVLGFAVRWPEDGVNGRANPRPEKPRGRPGAAAKEVRSALSKPLVSVVVVVPGLVAGGLGGYLGLDWLVAAGLIWLVLGIVVGRMVGAGRSDAR